MTNFDWQELATAIGGYIPAPSDGDTSTNDSWCNIKFEGSAVSVTCRRQSWRIGAAASIITVTAGLRLPLHRMAVYGTDMPECKVNAGRGIDAIAADIRRKILAPMIDIERAAQGAYDAQQLATAQLVTRVAALALISPRIQFDAPSDDGNRVNFYVPDIGRGYVKSDGAVVMDRLNFSDGAALLKLFASSLDNR